MHSVDPFFKEVSCIEGLCCNASVLGHVALIWYVKGARKIYKTARAVEHVFMYTEGSIVRLDSMDSTRVYSGLFDTVSHVLITMMEKLSRQSCRTNGTQPAKVHEMIYED